MTLELSNNFITGPITLKGTVGNLVLGCNDFRSVDAE